MNVADSRLLVQAAAPGMKRRGRIVLISSETAYQRVGRRCSAA
jgi:NAD(P)-dependent dehydrogenase (short-subunit alcohol dehydrogenase family)